MTWYNFRPLVTLSSFSPSSTEATSSYLDASPSSWILARVCITGSIHASGRAPTSRTIGIETQGRFRTDNSHRRDGSGPILGVISTNGYVFGDEAGTKDTHTIIIKDLSRVNHSSAKYCT
ncbi:hypothetical protein ARMGADRAFT_1030765 [Armillaria gallica]|uniref:Uncharacterized protein n=1 Tax=Armillaria gallica TaxID=47427 RepID=A0A2H3DB69_ARMGA|nr:hypothetical protein ARMGADRAFT_1030765 [Armillaria gallica]